MIERALSKRFKLLPEDVKDKIGKINDVEKLNSIFDEVLVINKIDQFYQYL